ADGGGLDAEHGNVTLVRVTVDHNHATEKGGGLYAPNGTVTLRDSTVKLNFAGLVAIIGGLNDLPPPFLGGGVFAHDVTAINSTVSGNVAFTGSGGGINATTVNLTDSTVSGNIASLGGGVVAQGGTILNSTIVENTATTNAGGVLWTAGVD